MASAQAIGLNVNEREVADTPVVAGPPIGQSGLVFSSERGPVGVAVEMDGLTFARKVFGEPNISYNSFFCLRGLFNNAGSGGAKVFGSRVVAAQAAAAQPAKILSTTDETYALAPGDDITIDLDNVGPLVATFDAAAAQADGAAATFPWNAAGTEVLNFTIDNGAAIAVTFTVDASTTLEETLSQINAQGSGFKAIDNAGQIRIESDSEGTDSEVDILAGTANIPLGLTVATNVGTGDVANIAAVTAAEVETLLEADITNLIVNLSGDTFELESPNVGLVASEIDISAGLAVTKLGLTITIVNGTAAAGGGPTPASTIFKRSAISVWNFTAGWRGYQDPGIWANARVFVELVATPSDSSKRDVLIYIQQASDPSPIQQELFEGLDATNVVGKINNPFTGSEYVTVNIESGDTGVPDVTSSPTDVGTDIPGDDGVETPTNTDYSDQLSTLDGLDIQVVGNLDLEDATWAGSLETYCTNRGDVLGVAQALRGATVAGLVAEFASILKAKSFVAIYRSYAKVSDAVGGTIAVPVIGHVIGAGYVRKPRAAGNLPHIAPAGPTTSLLDVQDVEESVVGQADLLSLATGSNVNAVVFESGNGFFIKTSRTMSTLGKHVSIHVRLLTNFILVAFRRNLSSFEQEGNNITTRRRLRDSIVAFMKVLNQQGAFETAGGFENNVAVVCDVGNNPQNIIQQRRLVCDVTFRPVEIAEEVQINVVQTRDGILVSDS